MENKKISLSRLQKKEKYRVVVEIENQDGTLDYVYVENPRGEKYEKLFELIENFSEYSDEENGSMSIYMWMFENLTNIELDEDLVALEELEEYPELFEIIFNLKEIFSEVQRNVILNLISIYSESKTKSLTNTLVSMVESSLQLEKELEEKDEENKE